MTSTKLSSKLCTVTRLHSNLGASADEDWAGLSAKLRRVVVGYLAHHPVGRMVIIWKLFEQFRRGCSTSANSTSDNSTSASWPKSNWPKSKLAEVDIGRSRNWPKSKLIGRNRTDGVCSVSSFSLSFFFFCFVFTFLYFFLVLTHLSLHFVSVLFLFSSPKT